MLLMDSSDGSNLSHVGSRSQQDFQPDDGWGHWCLTLAQSWPLCWIQDKLAVCSIHISSSAIWSIVLQRTERKQEHLIKLHLRKKLQNIYSFLRLLFAFVEKAEERIVETPLRNKLWRSEHLAVSTVSVSPDIPTVCECLFSSPDTYKPRWKNDLNFEQIPEDLFSSRSF